MLVPRDKGARKMQHTWVISTILNLTVFVKFDCFSFIYQSNLFLDGLLVTLVVFVTETTLRC